MFLVLGLDFNGGGLRNCWKEICDFDGWRWSLKMEAATVCQQHWWSPHSQWAFSAATLRWIYFHVYFTVCWSKTVSSSICFPSPAGHENQRSFHFYLYSQPGVYSAMNLRFLIQLKFLGRPRIHWRGNISKLLEKLGSVAGEKDGSWGIPLSSLPPPDPR